MKSQGPYGEVQRADRASTNARRSRRAGGGKGDVGPGNRDRQAGSIPAPGVSGLVARHSAVGGLATRLLNFPHKVPARSNGNG